MVFASSLYVLSQHVLACAGQLMGQKLDILGHLPVVTFVGPLGRAQSLPASFPYLTCGPQTITATTNHCTNRIRTLLSLAIEAIVLHRAGT